MKSRTKRANALIYFFSLWEKTVCCQTQLRMQMRRVGRRIMCSALIKRNKDDLRRTVLMWAFPLTRVKGLETSWCGWLCLCCHYLDRGQVRALGSILLSHLQQHLVGKWPAEGAAQLGNLWEGQDGVLRWIATKRRRKQKTHGKGKLFLGILTRKASCSKVQCNSTHKYLPSNNHGLGIGLNSQYKGQFFNPNNNWQVFLEKCG